MQFRGKGKARNFFGKRPSHSLLRLLCFMDRILLPGKEGQVFRVSALCSAATWEWRPSTVIYCFPLLLCLQPCSNWSPTDHPPSPAQCLAGLADSASIEKVNDQNELRNSYNYYMMTPKRLRRKRFSETRTERQVGNVRLDGVYLSSPSLHTNTITCLSKCYHPNGEVRMGPFQWFRANEKWCRLTRLSSAGKTNEGKSIWEGEELDTGNLSGLRHPEWQCFNSIVPQHVENCKFG